MRAVKGAPCTHVAQRRTVFEMYIRAGEKGMHMRYLRYLRYRRTGRSRGGIHMGDQNERDGRACVTDDGPALPAACSCGHDYIEHDRDGRCRHGDFDDAAPGDMRWCPCSFFEPAERGAFEGAGVG